MTRIVGFIPAKGSSTRVPSKNKQRVRGVPLFLWAANNLSRVLEREDIFEKNTALEDACGKLMKEKTYLQQQLAGAINSFTDQQTRWMARMAELTAQQSQATADAQTDPERH